MFNFIKNKLSKIYSHFSEKLQSLFDRNQVDELAIKELEKILITSDVGFATTHLIIQNLNEQIKKGALKSGQDLKKLLAELLINSLEKTSFSAPSCAIYLLVGINGSGKTTCAAKLAYKLKNEGKKVLLVAADTFRAAAVDQLYEWAKKIGVDIHMPLENQHQDPAAVIFGACQKFHTHHYDALVIDTAGRLQTKTNLMKELEKIKRVIERQLPNKSLCTLLTLDAMLGQNSLEQARVFHESTTLSGIIMTKMDGTGKGGIIFSVVQELSIPLAFISYGEKINELKIFNAQEYVTELLT